MFNKKKKRMRDGGFAMLVFVIIIAMSLLFMMIGYAEKQKQIADNVREIIWSERRMQAALLCAGYISNTLARYPYLNDDLVLDIINLKGDRLDCHVVSFDNCIDGACDYRAIIEGSAESGNSRIYMEWRLEEYRFYVSKLRIARAIDY